MMLTTLAMASVLLFGDFADLFEAHVHRYTGGQYHNELFRYRLFVPHSMEPTKQYPLLVWLHGLGEAGSDNQRNLNYLNLLLDDPDHIEQFRYFILVVQCPKMNPGWFHSYGDVDSGVAQSDDILTVTAEILQKTMRKYPVDPDRVYLAGVCSGASGCWEMAIRYPELFAAVVPMTAPRGDVSRVTKLVNIPIWAFISISEQENGVKDMVAALKSVGGNVHLTVTPTPSHDSWSEPMRGGVMDWMLTQRRGSPSCWTPPGYSTWQWWHILTLPCALLVFLRLAWCIEQRRRWRKALEPETTESDFSIGPLLPGYEPEIVEGFENREGTETTAG